MNERAIFIEALQKERPAERAAYLDGACRNDVGLRQQVDTLLREHEQLGSFLEAPAAVMVVTLDEALTEQPGRVIGPYKLMEQIGEGGMGLVFVAEQQQPVRRKVALKVIKPGMDSKSVIARFEAERQALALMDHPNIARVFEAGTTDSGRPYFVMELVKGVSVTDYCDQHRLTTRQRLELFIPVCQAVQHAHQKGIIHRDLKPSNVLVAVHDVAPVVKVIDFGVAKAMGQQLTDKTVYTGFAQMVGTPLYMSPEQAGLSSLDVDTRSDIYSLGVLLYELLTGTTPFDSETLRQASYDEMRRIIREEEPPRPSTRLSTLERGALSTVSERRGAEPRQLSQLVRGELDWIVMKALDKDRNRRYESANSLAQDVQRYLDDEPVLACPPSAGYRLRKFARRHKVGLAGATLALAMLAVMAGSVGWVAGDRGTRRARAEERVLEALEVAELRLPDGNPHAADLVTAVRQAEAQLDSGLVSAALRQRVERVLADQAMLARIEEIRLAKAEMKDKYFDTPGADPAYATAFRKYGIDVEALGVQEAGTQIRGRMIALHLAVALDDWALARRDREKKAGTLGKRDPTEALSWQQLLQVAQVADPDPWRGALREALAKDQEGREDLKKLAVSAPIQKLSPTTVYLFGHALAKQEGTVLAVEVLRKGQQRYPADFWINQELANGLAEMQPPQLDEAIGFYHAALALRPQHPLVHNNLGGALAKKSQVDEAIACYRKAIEIDPQYAVAHRNLGIVLGIKGQVDAAIACHRQAIVIDPKDALAHFNLAVGLRKKSQIDEAIACYRQAIEINPQYAQAHFSLGNALKAKGQVDEAIACYRQAIEIDPKYAGAHNNLGLAVAAKGRVDEAITCFHKAIEIDPKLAPAHTNLGILVAAKGQVDDAIACYRQAIVLDPKYALAHTNLGNELKAKGQLDEAIACYRKVIEIDPKYVVAHYNLGVALAGKGQLDETIACYHKAIEIDPQYVAAHNNLAWLLANCSDVRLRDPWQAVEHARKAIEVMPQDGSAWNTLGVCRYRVGEWEATVMALEKSIELRKGGNSVDWLFLAMAHWQLGDKEQAKKWYERAVEWMDKNKPQDEELKRFRTEAAELLGIKESTQ